MKGIGSLIAVDFLVLVLPLYVRSIIDTLNGEPQKLFLLSWINSFSANQKIFLIVGLYFLTTLVIAFFRYWWRVYIFWTSFPVADEHRIELFQKIHSQDRQFFMKWRPGDLLSALTTDTENIRTTMSVGFLMLLDSAINLVLFPLMMFFLAPDLTLIIVIPCLLIMALCLWLSRSEAHHYEKVQKLTAILSSKVFETASAARLIKIMGVKPFYEDIANVSNDFRLASIRVARFQSLFTPALNLISSGGLFAVLLVGGSAVIRGELSLSTLVAFQLYFNHLDWPIMALGWFIQMSRQSNASSKRLMKLNEDADSFKEGRSEVDNIDSDNLFDIRGVGFSYSGGHQPLLEDLSFKFKKGAWVAVSGAVGSGKSTLLELLSGRLKPVIGEIYFNGQNLRSKRSSEWASKILSVPQEPFIFSTSIRGNLSLDRHDISDVELLNLLRDLSFSDDFVGIKQGLGTRLGERGLNLSGGQRQRIILGRSLLRDREAYLFDDIFSQVDVETESKLLVTLRKYLQKNSSVVLVSHRENSISHCDHLIILSEGKLYWYEDVKEGLRSQEWKKICGENIIPLEALP